MSRTMTVSFALFLVGWLGIPAYSDDDPRIAQLERIIGECRHPLLVPPGIFKEIKTLKGVTSRPDSRIWRAVEGQGLVHVFVDSIVYEAIRANIEQFAYDLQSEGYSVAISRSWNQAPEQIRAVLMAEYASSGLVGIVLVGDIPAAWMETSLYYRSHFPTDYFYMDLNGTWRDSDGDGFYEHITENSEPEIWSGRITPSNCIFGDEAELLRQYFAKNHAYRTGSQNLPDRALGYLECTWYPEVETYLGSVYRDLTFVAHEDSTTALDYKHRLTQGFEWVHLLAHSSPWGSTFFLRGETQGGGSLFSYEMPVLNPQANFVVLNACSNARYAETNNLGLAYLFGSEHTVAVIGETRIMYGNDFEDLYVSLQEGKNLGEAFLDWMWWNYEWFWGCHIFGDPTLKPHAHGNPATVARLTPQRISEKTSEWDSSPVDASPFTDGNPSACVDGLGKVWVAWNAGRDARSNIWVSRRDGLSWSSPEEVAFAAPWDFHPSVVSDRSGNVWVFWQSYRSVESGIDGWDIYGIYDNGSVWSDPIRITDVQPYDVEPKSAVDSSGNVWVVWRTERKLDSDIMYSRYDGSSWTSPAYVTSTPDEERDPVITVDREGKVWVVWYARKNGNWDLYASSYKDDIWSAPHRVTVDPGYDLEPSATADASGRVWVVWRSNRNGNLNIYAKSHSGTTWSPDTPITSDPGDDLCPSLVCCGGDKILVTWQSNRDGDWNIYQSIHEGDWGVPVPVSTAAGHQIHPVALCLADGVPSPVFSSEGAQNWNIQYTTSFTAGDATSNGTVNLSDAIYVLNYLYRDGPLPTPLAAGDADVDGVVDLGDAVYILNYLFKGGDPPGCP